jgi:hypothetical protein
VASDQSSVARGIEVGRQRMGPSRESVELEFAMHQDRMRAASGWRRQVVPMVPSAATWRSRTSSQR